MIFPKSRMKLALWLPKISSVLAADAAMSYLRVGMTDLLKLLGGWLVGLFKSQRLAKPRGHFSASRCWSWIPAFAGMTREVSTSKFQMQ